MPLQALVLSTLTEVDDRPADINVSTQEIMLFADFLGQATCLNASKRPTAEELLMHPWMEDMLRRSIHKYEQEQGGGGSSNKV
jgi:hypothetical protein